VGIQTRRARGATTLLERQPQLFDHKRTIDAKDWLGAQPGPLFSDATFGLVASRLSDALLTRLQFTCVTMHRYIKWTRVWEDRTTAFLAKHMATAMDKPTIAIWRNCTAGLGAKAKYDLLRFYHGQQQMLLLRKEFIQPQVTTWAKQWHARTNRDEALDAHIERTTGRKPRNAETFYRYKRDDNRLKYNDEIESHLSFSGFVLYVPDDRLDEFKRLYLADTRRGIPSYFIERRTNYFPFFFDLDFHEPRIVSQDEVDAIVAVIQKLMRELYTQLDDHELRLVIYQSPVSFDKPGSPMYKFGLHGFWPGVEVNVRVACTIRRAIIHRLREAFGERPAYNRWASVLDESVYEPNGLRMFASAKAEKCRACGGKGKIEPKEMVLRRTTDVHPKRKGQTKFDRKRIAPDQLLPCTTCLEVGKTHIGRVYTLTSIIDGSGEPRPHDLDVLRRNLEAQFDCCTLRRPNGALMEPPKMPDWVKKIKESDLVDGLTQDELRRQRVREQRQITRGAGKGERVGPRDPNYKVSRQPLKIDRERVIQLLTETLRASHHYMDRKSVTSVEYEATGGYYIAKTDCHWCPNKQAEHRSNTIWFFVGFNAIKTKCYKREKIVMPGYGCFCADLSCDSIPTPMELRELLFPSLVEAEREKILLQEAMGKTDCASQDPNKHVRVWRVGETEPTVKLETGRKRSADPGSEDERSDRDDDNTYSKRVRASKWKRQRREARDERSDCDEDFGQDSSSDDGGGCDVPSWVLRMSY
jgi:hypothetical protein